MFISIFNIQFLINICSNSTRDFKYFENQGVKGPKPIPILGNMLDAFKMVRY